MATQLDIQNALNSLINDTTGHMIGYTDGRYYSQSSAPIEQFMRRLGVPVPALPNEAINGWTISWPPELDPYLTLETYSPDTDYPEGSIYVWEKHMAIGMNSQANNQVTVFEQNADPDGSVCGIKIRPINTQWHTCSHVLVWKAEAPLAQAPKPAKLPEAPMIVPILTKPYTVVTTIPGFAYWTGARDYSGTAVPIEPGEYVEYTQDKAKDSPSVRYIGRPGATMKYWINNDDNVLPPEPVVEREPEVPNNYVGPRESTTPPEPPPLPTPTHVDPPAEDEKRDALADYLAQQDTPECVRTYHPFPAKQYFIATRDYNVHNALDNDDVQPLNKGDKVAVHGRFMNNDHWYYRLRHPEDVNFDDYFGVPVVDNTGQAILLKDTPTVDLAIRQPAKAPGTVTILRDTRHLLSARLEEDVIHFIDDMLPSWHKDRKNKRVKRG